MDGCRAGWVVAGLGLLRVLPRFEDVLEAADGGVVGIDIPIGLPDVGGGPRACDVEARRLLPVGRKSSVFPAPARGADVARMSRQTFNILPKIAEVDALMTPSLQSRVVEVHPEVSFGAMAGAAMSHGKRTAPGRAERLAALGLSAVPVVRGAAADDVLDSLAVLWTAQRVARGSERRLGDGARDSRGLRMEIVV